MTEEVKIEEIAARHGGFDGIILMRSSKHSAAYAAHIDRGALLAEYDAKCAEIEALKAALNTPEVEDFAKGVVSEAQHQRERWGSDHDRGKSPLDWFWLVGYLAQKAASAQTDGNIEKALHHTISTAAALANWHAAIGGLDSRMTPGAPIPVEAEGERIVGEATNAEG